MNLYFSPLRSPAWPAVLPGRQQGVVLIIALVLLVVMSLLAITALRNTSSNESLAGNVRTTELATQAADIALRHCEASALKLRGGASPYVTNFSASNLLPASSPPRWQDMTSQTGWDSALTAAYVLPLALVNQTNMPLITYQRPPECMVEPVPGVTLGTATFYVITARGFGPEVEKADAARSRPVGSEVGLQSHIAIE